MQFKYSNTIVSQKNLKNCMKYLKKNSLKKVFKLHSKIKFLNFIFIFIIEFHINIYR